MLQAAMFKCSDSVLELN